MWILALLFIVVLLFVGTKLVIWGHKEEDDYLGAGLTIVAGIILAIAIFWFGEISGFQAGFDWNLVKWILIFGVSTLVLSLLFIKLEKISKGEQR
jgi:hypothetical protein